MDFIKITDSTNLESYHYNHLEQKLFIIFNGGTKYVYEFIPQELFGEFLVTESKGSFLATRIKGKFPCTKIIETKVDAEIRKIEIKVEL